MPMRFFPGSDEPGGPTGAAATDADPQRNWYTFPGR
jgi:hypothetical protein